VVSGEEEPAVTLGLVRAGLVLLMAGGAWALVAAMTRPVVRAALPAPGSPQHAERAPAAPRVEEASIKRVLGRAPFRADRRVSTVRYDPSREVVTDAPSPADPRPALAVSGIIWGDEPAAVIEGVPGVEGSTVLRSGESAAGLRVVRISQNRVVIRGMDTTWGLTVREPWK
jgi:hypothetical protein